VRHTSIIDVTNQLVQIVGVRIIIIYQQCPHDQLQGQNVADFKRGICLQCAIVRPCSSSNIFFTQ
jgi:hypothetical protein